MGVHCAFVAGPLRCPFGDVGRRQRRFGRESALVHHPAARRKQQPATTPTAQVGTRQTSPPARPVSAYSFGRRSGTRGRSVPHRESARRRFARGRATASRPARASTARASRPAAATPGRSRPRTASVVDHDRSCSSSSRRSRPSAYRRLHDGEHRRRGRGRRGPGPAGARARGPRSRLASRPTSAARAGAAGTDRVTRRPRRAGSSGKVSASGGQRGAEPQAVSREAACPVPPSQKPGREGEQKRRRGPGERSSARKRRRAGEGGRADTPAGEGRPHQPTRARSAGWPGSPPCRGERVAGAQASPSPRRSF